MKRFDPDQHICLFGLVPISGFGENAMYEIEESGPLYNVKIGVQGDVSRSKNLARTAMVKFNLMNTSRTNAYLSTLVEAGLRAPGGLDVVPIMIQDLNGTSNFEGGESWIEERPKPAKGKEATENTWIIRVAPPYVFFEGGT